jgi:hypothetical protein
MNINVIITCVAQKNVPKTVSILDENIKEGSVEFVFEQWKKILGGTKLKPVKAADLYMGLLWNRYMDLWGMISGKTKNTKLWIISAGHGFIGSEEMIVPYNITFQNPQFDIPSVFSKVKIDKSKDSKREALRKWWKLLTDDKADQKFNSISKLIKSGSEDDKYIIVAGRDYIDAVYDDLLNGLKHLKNKENLIIISNNVNDSLLRTLEPHWLYADKKFINIKETNSSAVNASIAKELFWRMFSKKNDFSPWTITEFNSNLLFMANGLDDVEVFDRKKGTDEEIKDHIRSILKQSVISFSKMHEDYRKSGRACEQKRFQKLYNEVKAEIDEENRRKVTYKKRDTRMSFFLPDWDDRVDPGFDFVEELSVPDRIPYEHDMYHYELYGNLNCDGILISKSVLEDTPRKKDLASAIGIHKYLRLPSNVPVLGDCGAFNYAMDYMPPYETEETLQYYEDLGFNYGVSIDHLIVPAVYTKHLYFRKVEESWKHIEKEEFEELAKEPNVRIVKDRKSIRQMGMFEEETVLCNETFMDEHEKFRRYNMTLENGEKFIKRHKRKGYTFTPIGAAQGWDPESYAEMVWEYEKLGYKYIALGGMVKTKTEDIIQVLKEINKHKKEDTKLHIFGVARPDAIEAFLNLGVTSVDNAGVLRQAWLSSTDNYYAPGFNNYSAIRIPQTTEKKISEVQSNGILNGKVIDEADIFDLEDEVLEILRAYDRGEADLKRVMKKVRDYNKLMGVPDKIIAHYERTLEDRPWQKCPCRICQETGIDVIIFRGNNRNRRRGFHNTWVYYNWFKSLTGDVK